MRWVWISSGFVTFGDLNRFSRVQEEDEGEATIRPRCAKLVQTPVAVLWSLSADDDDDDEGQWMG